MATERMLLYLMPHKIQKRRYGDMKRAAKCREFNVADKFCPEVTHVITEFETYDQACRHLDINIEDLDEQPTFLKISWFTDSIKARKQVEILERHRLPRLENQEEQIQEETAEPGFPQWACQRSTPLKHHNNYLSTQLEILQKYAEMNDSDNDYSRALAFRRASCVLKSFPYRVTNVNQLRGIKDIGPHSRRVIIELLEDGYCDEIHKIVINEWFKKMKMFTSVFGVGPSTAKKWIDRGWSSIKDAQESPDISKDWRLQWGLAFHDDLMDPVKSHEAYRFTELVKTEAEKILPGIIVILTGGFRRGKPQGHDVDILFSHSEEDKTIGFLAKLITRLQKMNLILCGSHESSTFHEKVLSEDYKLSARGQLDHFEKWLGICKLPKDLNQTDDELSPLTVSVQDDSENVPTASLDDCEPKSKRQKIYHGENSPFSIANSERDWIARRVDLILSPYSQYYYALVGWTGSKQLNRDLRLFSQKVFNRKLTSHGLHDFSSNTNLPASSEKEVFDHFNLQYQEPENRNC